MNAATSGRARGWRRLTDFYYRLLCMLLALLIFILVFPVTLQVFARFIPALPHYIWTEELARLMLVWTVMIGSIVGVREWSHFDVDVWPRLSPRKDAALRLVSRTGVLVIGIVFAWMGIEFTRIALYRISELAELPLWIINVAWPIAGASWLLFLGEQMLGDARLLLGGAS